MKALLAALLLTLCAAVPANAATLTTTDQGVADQYRIARIEQLPSKVTQVESLVAGWGYYICWSRQDGLAAYSIVGIKVWTFRQKVEWCGDGSRIVDAEARAWGDVYTLFWSYRLDQFRTSKTTLPPQRFTAFGQGEFKLCAFGNIGCTQFVYPWIEQRVWADGRRVVTHS